MAKPVPSFYVFHGADEFSRAETLADLKRRLGPPDVVALNTTYLDGEKLSLAELRQACDALPFMADKRLVVVKGLLTRRKGTFGQRELDALCDYLARLPETTRLVFVEESTMPASHPVLQFAQQSGKGYVRLFDAPDVQALPGWVMERVRKHGGRIEPQAAQHLAAAVGADLRLLDQEIAKLVTYVGGGRAITPADVEAATSYVQAAVVFDLVDGLGQRNGRLAAQTLHRLLETGEHPLGLLTMIVRQFRLLLLVKTLKAEGASVGDVAQALKLHPFPARKVFDQANHFTQEQLEAVYRHLVDTDAAIKSGEMDAEVALDLLVAGLAAEA